MNQSPIFQVFLACRYVFKSFPRSWNYAGLAEERAAILQELERYDGQLVAALEQCKADVEHDINAAEKEANDAQAKFDSFQGTYIQPEDLEKQRNKVWIFVAVLIYLQLHRVSL